MRTLKPLALTVLNAPFQHGGKIRLVLVVGAMVSLDGTLVDHEQTLWRIIAQQPGSRGFIDEIKPKTRGEALLSGMAFAPGGTPAPVVAVRLQVGAVAKEVWAIGDRTWRLTGPTEPVPFTSMPLSCDRAFGGEGFHQNPTGKGFAATKTEAGESIRPLPNLEIAKKLITSPGDRPPVAGFSPVDPALPQRMKKLGTYDEKWLRTRYPEMAEDFDETYFNIAPEDQWIDGFWVGGEPFFLQNVHADRPKIEGVVPSLAARALVTRKGAEPGALEDVALRCDTLWFLPNEERLLMLFRGGVDVVDEEGSDLVDVIVGLERAGDAKPVDHYRKVRQQRLDKDKGALYAMRDRDLLPSDMRVARSRELACMDELLERENLLQANMHRRSERELAAARANLEAHGVDPDGLLPREVPKAKEVDLDSLPEIVDELNATVEKAKAEAEAHRVQALAQAKELSGSLGLHLEDKVSTPAVGGPPGFTAEGHIAHLRRLLGQARFIGMPPPKGAELVDDPSYLATLVKTETALLEAYRMTAHFMPPARTLEREEAASLRRQVETILIADHALAGRDFTGADLSGMDFAGRDLTGTLLEKAKLVGCSFRGANLTGAVLARADLTGADLDDANAMRANFGAANLSRATLRRVDLSDAILMDAEIGEADLTGATLDQTHLSNVQGERAVLAEIKAKSLQVLKGNLRGADLHGARLDTSVLLDVDLTCADLTDAVVFRTGFLDVTLEDARMRGVSFERVSFAKVEKGCSLARCDLRGASLRRTNFRGVDLAEADLREADLRDADLSKADLRGATLEAARAAHVRMMDTDLTGADLARADLLGARMGRSVVRGARFEEANLFRADADRMQGDDKTTFTGANLKLVRVTPATTAKPSAARPSAAEPPPGPTERRG